MKIGGVASLRRLSRARRLSGETGVGSLLRDGGREVLGGGEVRTRRVGVLRTYESGGEVSFSHSHSAKGRGEG